MTGYCYIDGIDIYDTYGVFIEGDGYDELLSFPAIVEPDKNDWPEEDGIEVDLSEPHVQAREIRVDFAVVNNRSWRPFFDVLTTSGYRVINIPPLGRSWSIRVSEMPELERYTGAELFSVNFVEDMPIIPTGYPVANADIRFPSLLSLDGTRLDKYGIIITGGLDDLERSSRLKKALTRTNSRMNGQLYDTGVVRFAEKEVTFGCCLNAVQMADFWNLYNAFFGDLLKQGLRAIGYKGSNYQAYYRKSGNWRLHSHIGPVMCEFDLTMCITKEV